MWEVDSTSPCKICLSNERIKEKVCVIEEIGDLWVIEKSKAYRGQYHVLGGVLSAIDGVGPEDLNLSSLFQRIKAGEIKELIIATNATMEGQITAQYIADACNNKNVVVNGWLRACLLGRIRFDLNTLSTAFTSRSEMKSS